jgi:hypothetical protein
MKKPTLGAGCTLRIGSDSYPYTVVAVFEINTGFDVQIQADKATTAEGHDYYGAQKWDFERNHRGDVKMFRFETFKADRGLREIVKNEKGRYVFAKHDCYLLDIGERRKYSDPSF